MVTFFLAGIIQGSITETRIHRQDYRAMIKEAIERSAALRDVFRKQGSNIGASASQNIPITVGAADRAMALSAALRERGLFVPGIRPPSVPEGESILRVSLSYGHTPEMIERLLEALEELR